GWQSLGKLVRRAPLQTAAPLQAVIAANIVIDAGLEVRQCWHDGVAVRGVQVAAARIAAQRPAVAPEFLPGRQSEGQLKEDGDTLQVQRSSWHCGGCVEIGVGSGQAVRRQGQLNPRGPLESAEWVR